MGVTNGQRLVVDIVLMFSMLKDRRFHELLPADLKEVSSGLHKRVLTAAMAGCGRCETDPRRTLLTFTDGLVNRMIGDTALTEAFVNYVVARRGFRPRPIVLHYKDMEGSLKTLEL